MLDAGNEL